MLTAFLFFLGSTIICHLPIVKVKIFNREGLPRDKSKWKRQWEAPDYLWLGLASLAIIGAVIKLNRMTSKTEIKLIRGYAGYQGSDGLATVERDVALRSSDPRKTEIANYFEAEFQAFATGDLF
jgi:hypothetical protein